MADLIRRATAEDAGAVLKIYSPYITGSVVSFEMTPPTLEEMQTRIKNIVQEYPWLVYEVNGEVVGYAYASQHHIRKAYQWSVDVAVYISGESHRQGIGRKLYTKLFEILREQGYYKVYAGITLPNSNSVGLHESFRFYPVGIYESVGFKNGKWHDVGWWQMRLKELSTPTRVPVPFRDVKGI